MRNTLELKRTAVSRLGKQVVDLIDVTVAYAEKTVIDDVTWLIGPGDRFGILGENGSGKTTLLNVIQGALEPTLGRVKVGKSVKFAILSQHLNELNELGSSRVREVLSRYNTRYEIDGKELTPAQMLERLGFSAAQLSTPVSDLSGGQKRRLQLMLILLDKPNVLILDEPDNDLDIDMLAVVENLLDSWPGTLLLITHDRHLMERVTDDQFAVLGGKIRHVPGGVDEYLRLVDGRGGAREDAGRTAAKAEKRAEKVATREVEREKKVAAAMSQAEERSLKKELASTERKLDTQCKKADSIRAEMQQADPSDHTALVEIQARLAGTGEQIADLEERWMELSIQLGADV